MGGLTKLVQLTLAISVVSVWVFRFNNTVEDFKNLGLNDLIRNSVDVSKISLATLVVVGIWYSSFVFTPSFFMGLLMIAA